MTQIQSQSVGDFPIVIRRAKESDRAALARLAALDSADLPIGPMLVAETSGSLRAALSLHDGTTIADPFYPSAPMVGLLMTFATQGQGGRRMLERRWRRRRGRKAVATAPHHGTGAVLA